LLGSGPWAESQGPTPPIMNGPPHVTTLVLGVGNLLLSDEGVGLRVVERLTATYELPPTVQVLDGGTLGMDLLYYLEGIDYLLIIDAVETGSEPGTLVRLENDDVPAFLSVKISPHQIGVPDMLFAARLQEIYPERVVLFGIQPANLAVGLELSPEVAEQLDVLVEQVVDQLTAWKQAPSPRENGEVESGGLLPF
jgi:hydrogenase maturation protease